MNDIQIKAITLFFFYCIPEELQAYAYINKCKDSVASKIEGLSVKKAYPIIVQHMYKHWAQYNKKKLKLVSADKQKKINELQDGAIDKILINENIDLSPWKEFQINSHDDELLFVIWSKILEIPDEAIAKGLGLSVGTVRYRTSKGLKELGKSLIPGSTGYNFRRETDA